MLFPTSWWRPLALAGLLALASSLLLAPAAQAHHLMLLMHLKATPLTVFLSGLAHPIFGPDHLLFLLALSLVGLQQRARWMLGLLATGLAGSCLGLIFPGLPAAEALVSFTLVVVAMVLVGRWDRRLLLPAFTLHGYVLSASVLGWTSSPLVSYLFGLLIGQGALLLLGLVVLRHASTALLPSTRKAMALILLGLGMAWTWSSLVG